MFLSFMHCERAAGLCCLSVCSQWDQAANTNLPRAGVEVLGLTLIISVQVFQDKAPWCTLSLGLSVRCEFLQRRGRRNVMHFLKDSPNRSPSHPGLSAHYSFRPSPRQIPSIFSAPLVVFFLSSSIMFADPISTRNSSPVHLCHNKRLFLLLTSAHQWA